MKAELRLAEAVEDLDLEEPAVVDAGVAPLGHGELDVELVVVERLLGHDVRSAAVVAAEQGGPRRSAAADRHEPAWIGRIEPDVVADDPDFLGTRIAKFPAGQVLAVEERLPALAAVGNSSAMRACACDAGSSARAAVEPTARPSDKRRRAWDVGSMRHGNWHSLQQKSTAPSPSRIPSGKCDVS